MSKRSIAFLLFLAFTVQANAGTDNVPWVFPYQGTTTVKDSLQFYAKENKYDLLWKNKSDIPILIPFTIDDETLSQKLQSLSQRYNIAIGVCRNAKTIVVYDKTTPRADMNCDGIAKSSLSQKKPFVAPKNIPISKASSPRSQIYDVKRGERLSDALERWKEIAGWKQLVWNVPTDIVFDASHVYPGSVTSAAESLSQTPAVKGNGIGIQTWKANKTIRAHEVE